MRKIATVLAALVLAAAAGAAEVYRFDYVSTNDVDYVVIKNQTQADLRVRFCAGSCCAVVPVPSGKAEKVRVDIEYEEDYNTDVIPVQFECRDRSGASVPVTWLMDNAHHDINITLLPDDGWHF